jgi:hypothetical protein
MLDHAVHNLANCIYESQFWEGLHYVMHQASLVTTCVQGIGGGGASISGTICWEGRGGGGGSSIPGYHLLRGKRGIRVQHPWLPSAESEEGGSSIHGFHLLRGKRIQHPWLPSANKENLKKDPASLATICGEGRGAGGSNIPGYHLLRGKRRRGSSIADYHLLTVKWRRRVQHP